MSKDKFLKRKQDVLSKIDKSFKKKWDKKILRLCMKINSVDDFYTTSSCSGRAILMLDEAKKQRGLFVRSYHDKISFEELKKEMEKIACSQSAASPTTSPKKSLLRLEIDVAPSQTSSRLSTKESINDKIFLINNFKKLRVNESELPKFPPTRPKQVKFKMEPCILHVACKSLEDAQILYDKAKLAGWKKSGIIATKNHVMLELNSTERLEFPIIYRGEILVNDKFLKLLVKETNKKLEKSWEKIERLEKQMSCKI